MASWPDSKRHRGNDLWCISPGHAAELQGAGNKYLKLLINHQAAGALIGKGGSDLAKLEAVTNSCVRVSSQRATYPGTGDRVVGLAGGQDELDAAIDSVIGACNHALELAAQRDGGEHRAGHLLIKLAIPNSACGLVIGKKGVVQKDISTRLGVPLQISKVGENLLASERLVTVAGNAEAVAAAVREVSRLVQEDPELSAHLQTPTEDGMSQSGVAPAPAMSQAAEWPPAGKSRGKGPPPPPQPAYSKDSWSKNGWSKDAWGGPVTSKGYSDYQQKDGGGGDFVQQCTIYFQVSDPAAANVIGKGGAAQKAIEQQCGCTVKLSKRGEDVPALAGTNNRQVTITGPMQGVHAAHAMVLERTSEVREH